jgi:predicted nucleic acid-binding protein
LKAFVLDASAALGWILDRPVHPRAAQARTLITAGATPVVPTLWLQEVSNAIVIAERRGRLTAAQVRALAADLEDFMQVVEVDSLRVRPTILIETAQRTLLSVYDATYLELASRRRLPLATLDDKLQEAAQRAGLTLI